MRLFQNAGLYPTYRKRLDRLASNAHTFSQRFEVFIDDRWGAPHILKPVLEKSSEAFFTNGDDDILQHQWAAENGLSPSSTLEQILLAQIEHHRTEVFYNGDPMRWPSSFVQKLPGCVRLAIAWRAAPSRNVDFGSYNAILCNFPSILASYAANGWRGEYFTPGHDPVMDEYAANNERPVDIIFIGGYTRHHLARARTLELVAHLRDRFHVVFHLDRSRPTRLAESLPGKLLPLGKYCRPKDIRTVTAEPLFGRDMYSAISRAKIVFNAAIDMSGPDRGNMRCWETLGLGSLLVSDAGNYPKGMVDDDVMLLYQSPADAPTIIESALADPNRLKRIASAGQSFVRTQYSKAVQWQNFCTIAGCL